MRPLATTLVVLFVLSTAVPVVTAGNECASSSTCQSASTTLVSQSVDQVPDRTFYVYGAAATCVPPANGPCAGKPYASFVGLVYEETNGVSGLQRFATEASLQPDKPLIV